MCSTHTNSHINKMWLKCHFRLNKNVKTVLSNYFKLIKICLFNFSKLFPRDECLALRSAGRASAWNVLKDDLQLNCQSPSAKIKIKPKTQLVQSNLLIVRCQGGRGDERWILEVSKNDTKHQDSATLTLDFLTAPIDQNPENDKYLYIQK